MENGVVRVVRRHPHTNLRWSKQFRERSPWCENQLRFWRSHANASRVSRDAALPALSEFSGVPRRPPEHTRPGTAETAAESIRG